MQENADSEALFRRFVRRRGGFGLFERALGAVQKGGHAVDPGRKGIVRRGGQARFAAHLALQQEQCARDGFQLAAGEWEVHRTRVMLGRGVMEDGRIPQAAVRRMIGGSGGCGADAELSPIWAKVSFCCRSR